MEDAGGFLGMDRAYGEDLTYEVDTCCCKICEKPTTNTGTQLCDPCWEVQARIDDYLKHPKGYEDILARTLKARLTRKDR